MAEDFDVSYDLVVVGGGGSGMSAAIEGAKKGLSVAILEKMDKLGGNTAYAEGHAAFESVEQEKHGFHVSKEEGYRAIVEYSHWNANTALTARYVENANQTVLKMHEEGVVYTGIKDFQGGGGNLPTWHIPEGNMAGLCSVLESSCARRGIDVFLKTQGTSLVMEDGRVTGLVATDQDGETVRVGARAVVLASGGYGSNPEMLGKYARIPHPERVWAIGSPGNTGDGLSMALEVGGREYHAIGTAQIRVQMPGKTRTASVNVAGGQPYYWVDSTGRRYVNEEIATFRFEGGRTVAQTLESTSWSILDKGLVDHLVNDGVDMASTVFVPRGTKLTSLPMELEQDVPLGETVFRADSLEELAEQVGFDADAFIADIEAYNKGCAEGLDHKYYKNRFLYPLQEPPFYALKMGASVLVTSGGVDIDEYMRVLSKDGTAIEGLYSVGCDSSNLFGDSYGENVPGMSAGFALTSGWLAADHAAELIASRS